MTDLIKPVVGILTSHVQRRGEILGELGKHFGPADIVGEWQPFTHTHYYEGEMGAGLSRCFVSFEALRPSHEARYYKKWGTEIEDRFKVDGKRGVNVDPGYLDANKVVLISAKHGGHKIAIAEDVYADMLLWYNKGWQAHPWAFPDFRDGSLFPIFQKMRRAYKAALKGHLSPNL
jgi:hypothetical protein